MGYFIGNVYSSSMLMETQLQAILPQDGRRYVWDRRPRTLILLHGLSDNASTWVRLSSIERYAERYNLAVIIPEVQRSWYQDMVYGQSPYTYIAKELPQMISKLFRTATDRESLMIAGWSMGGYGALKCALSFPDSFSCCGALSGAYDLNLLINAAGTEGAPDVLKGLGKDMKGIFGHEMEIPESANIEWLIKKSYGQKGLPDIYMSCGRQDFLYPVFDKVRMLCRSSLVKYKDEEFMGGHEWEVCDRAVEHMLDYFLGEEIRK